MPRSRGPSRHNVEVSDMDNRLDEVVPLGDALAEVARRGFPCSLDKWGRFVDWGLMRPPERILGTNRVGISRRRVERLHALLSVAEPWVEKDERATGRALVFRAAYSGFEVLKPEPLAEYIDEQTRRFFKIGRRLVRRLGPGFNLTQPLGPNQAAKAAHYAQKTVRVDHLVGVAGVTDHHVLEFNHFKEAVFGLFFSMVFGDADSQALYQKTLPVAKAVILDSEKARLFSADFAATESKDPWYGDPELSSNPMFLSLRRASNDLPRLIRGVGRARRLIERLGGVASSSETASIPTAPVNPSEQRVVDTIIGSVAPMLAALMIHMDVDEGRARSLSQLDNDEPIAIESLLNQLIELSAPFYQGGERT